MSAYGWTDPASFERLEHARRTWDNAVSLHRAEVAGLIADGLACAAHGVRLGTDGSCPRCREAEEDTRVDAILAQWRTA